MFYRGRRSGEKRGKGRLLTNALRQALASLWQNKSVAAFSITCLWLQSSPKQALKELRWSIMSSGKSSLSAVEEVGSADMVDKKELIEKDNQPATVL